MRPRVALTTTSDRVAGLLSVALVHGLDPMGLPCIEVTAAPMGALDQARKSAAGSDWLLVTSARTVGLLWPGNDLPAVDVAAVGHHTAAAVRRAGGNVSLIGDSGAAGLVQELLGFVEGKSICFPHGRGADLSHTSALEGAGAGVSTWEVYATKPVPPRLDRVDAAVFGSPSAVEGWFRSRDLDGVLVGAIGGTTGAALDDRGYPPEVIPMSPDYSALLELVAARIRERISS